MGIGIGTTCFGDIGRSGSAVGYLPATANASGLAKKPARLPYSSPNAKKTHATVAHPNLLVAGAVQPGQNSTSDKHRQNRARNIRC